MLIPRLILPLITAVSLFLVVSQANAQVAIPGTDGSAESAITQQEAVEQVMAAAIGAPAKVDLINQATFRLTGTYQFVPRDVAARFFQAIGRPVPSDMVGLLMEGGQANWFATLRYVDEGHLTEKAIHAWSADDIMVSLREHVARENARAKDGSQIVREVSLWLVPPTYFPETHILTWAASIPPLDAQRERDTEAVHHVVVFGRDGYFHLEAVAAAGMVRERQYQVLTLMQGLTFLDGRRYQDFVPASDPVLTQGLQRVLDLSVMRKSSVLDWGWDTDNLIILTLGGITVLGAGLLALARVVAVAWRQRR
jgi:uncharacterized membrane-anchored protein